MPTKKLVALLLALLLAACFAGCSRRGSEAVMNIGGYDVSLDEYIYWALPYREHYEADNGDYFKENPDAAAQVFKLVDDTLIGRYSEVLWADQLGITVTEAELEQFMSEDRETFGGQKGLTNELNRLHATEAVYERLSECSIKLEKLYARLYDPASGLVEVSDLEVESYIIDHSVMGAKHIFIRSGEGSLERAESLLTQLGEGADFDHLMVSSSEDAGLEANPDGYTFASGDMDAAFERAVSELEIGGVSGIVESAVGYHIIMRTEPDREQVRYALLEQRIAQLYEQHKNSETPVEYKKLREQLKIKDIVWRGKDYKED